MKRNYTLLFSCSLLLLVVAGCQKERATSLQEGELRSAPLPGQPTYCRIESIWKNRFAIEEAFHLILYDEFENPIAITTPGIGTGRPWVTFIYDSWHRLREYRGEYIGGAFEFLHRYGFDKNGRIGIDTFYAFGQPIENPTHYLNRSISKIEYDNQNRVIKEVADFEFGGLHLETNYNYDAAGNLVHPDSEVTYDNKVNLFRTNDIWMFLARDYSVNNPFVADEYNSAGFPTTINTSPAPLFLQLNIPLSNAQISYGCRQAYW